MKTYSYYLGSNSYNGFYSLFSDYLQKLNPRRVFILKGGAGCGKSTFMKKAADYGESKGHSIERILCSGDPDSLDGVYFVENGIILLDGTAPHVLEPPRVGETGFYVDLSRFYHAPISGLAEKEAEYREYYRIAYQWLRAAGAIAEISKASVYNSQLLQKKGREWGFKHLISHNGQFSEKDIFMQAFSGSGLISTTSALDSCNYFTIGLNGNSHSLHIFLSEVLSVARSLSCSSVICHDPLQPALISALLFPEQKLMLTSDYGHLCSGLHKSLHLPPTNEIRNTDAELHRMLLLDRASAALQKAKTVHDQLEAAVHPAIDFEAISALCADFCRRYL